jgi:hypothetical protein
LDPKSPRDEKQEPAALRTLQDATQGLRTTGERIQSAAQRLARLRAGSKIRDEFGDDF